MLPEYHSETSFIFFLSKADQTYLRLVLVYVLTSFLFGCLHTQNDGNSRGLA